MSHWFEYFPGHFMWSQGIIFAVEMAPWGAAALGEIDQVGQRLRGREGDNDAWWAEWSAMADRLERWADAEATRGHQLTAGSLYLRAATYHFCGERFLPPGDRKVGSYRRCLRCFAEGAHRRYPTMERVEVPYEGTTLPAYFLPGEGVRGRGPAVVFFDGLDNAKELSVLFGGVELARRGISTLAIDGPGQGEALRLRGIPSRHDYEVPARSALEFLAARPDVDAARIGIMAFSMGGYYAPRAAACEPRFKLCVAWGGHFDYHAAWVRRRRIMESGGTRVSAPGFQLPWVLGVADMDAAMTKLKDYTLEGVAQRIQCPFLVVHGENDTIVPVDYARRLHDAVGSRVKTIRIFTAEEGGSEHCQEDNRQIGANFVADWIADHI